MDTSTQQIVDAISSSTVLLYDKIEVGVLILALATATIAALLAALCVMKLWK